MNKMINKEDIQKELCSADCLKKMSDKTKKEFHYTNEKMCQDLISLIPLIKGDVVLDAGSGKEYKPWYKNIPDYCQKHEYEIEEGRDFLMVSELKELHFDWIIGNPPFHEGWKFLDKASKISRKGIAFLGNLNFWNSCLPSRFELLKKRGFYLQKIHIVQDVRWYGRYYFLIFKKRKNNFISWNVETYK